MLTVRFDKLSVEPGSMFLDAGAGFGRHAFEAARRGARVVALDYAEEETTVTRATFAAMYEAGEISRENLVAVLRGDATRLPFADNTFDCIVTSEVLEHIQNDVAAIWRAASRSQARRHTRRHRSYVVAREDQLDVSDEYHAPKSVGGHVRIYSATELKAKLRSAGFDVRGSHHAHALHSPYWWLKCAVAQQKTTIH